MKLFITTCLSIVVLAVMAQANEEFDEKVYFADAEYFFVQEFYVDALHDFLELYNHGYEENANLNYLIGICYLNIPGQKSKSIEHFLKAEPHVSEEFKKSSLKEVYAPKDLYLYLGNAYRINNELDEAIDAYRKYQGMVGEENEFEYSFAEEQIQACETAKNLINKPISAFMDNIGAPINDNYPNFRPVLTEDENTLIFMTQLPFYDAIFVSNKTNDSWQSPVNITPELQSDGDQYVCDISDDGSMLLLTREEDLNSDIYISYQKDGIWSRSEPISEINTRFWESHACFSTDGKTIYFASNKVGGEGGMDIYVTTLDDEGKWTEPVNMGTPVNSPMNEDFPFITSDNKRLYYSSQQNPIMGGFDVFYCEMENDSWNGPFNMGYPINSTDDDVFYFPVNNGESAYVYRYDENGEGDYDIFRIGGLALEAEAVKGEIPVLENLIDKTQIAEEEATTSADEDIAAVTEEENMTDTEEEVVDGTEDTEADEEELVVEEEEEKITVVKFAHQPFFFDFDKYNLDAIAKQELDNLVSFLNTNNAIKIKIYGHTDSFGSIEYNKGLSKNRAIEAMNYLISKGISIDRISVVARHEEEPIAKTPDNATKENEIFRFNRRVEIEFLNADSTKFDIERINPVPEKYRIN